MDAPSSSNSSCHWVMINSNTNYHCPFAAWNIVPLCYSCALLAESHNLIDLLSLNPLKHSLLKDIVFKLFVALIPTEIWLEIRDDTLIRFVEEFYHPKKMLYKDPIRLNEQEINLLNTIKSQIPYLLS